MAVNVPETQILADSDTTVIVKVTGYHNGATTSNTKILQSNTVNYANTSRDCILEIEKIQYSVQFATGSLALEYISKVNTNNRIVNFSGRADGVVNVYIPNAANTPSGDLNLAVVGAANNDTYNFIITLRKTTKNSAFINVYVPYE